MALWCWNERGGLLLTGNVCGSRCVSLWNCDLMWIFGFFEVFWVVRGDRGVGVVEVA